jgi:transcriptional regulator with XRE-family HTH domain
MANKKTRLMAIRLKRGETRQKVSKYTGVPYNTLKRLEERASDLINVRYLRDLCEYYDEPFDVAKLLGV